MIKYFEVQHSAEQLKALKILKDNNDFKLKTLFESLNCNEIKTEINKLKQEKYK